MIKIVRIPEKLETFFEELKLTGLLRATQLQHVVTYILGLLVTGCRRTVTGISRAIHEGVHRAKRNEFLTQSQWDEAKVQMWIAYRKLRKLGIKPGDVLHFIMDDTHTKKRGKKMQGAGKYKDTTSGGFVFGHNIFMGVFYYRGFTIPYKLKVHLKPHQAKELKEVFQTLPQMAAEMIRRLEVTSGIKVVVLCDSGYMNKTVIGAIKQRGFTYVSVLPSNRNIRIKGRKRKVGTYRCSIPHREYRALKVRNAKGKQRIYFATDRLANIPSIGKVKIVFSRRKRYEKALAIVTNDMSLSRKQIIQTYQIRWVIEQFFKDTKQHLGLGEYQTTKLKGVVRHLHLVCMGYSLLIDRAIEAMERVEGKKRGNRKGVFGALSLMDLREKIRGLIFEDLLDYLQNKSDPKQVIVELRQLLQVG